MVGCGVGPRSPARPGVRPEAWRRGGRIGVVGAGGRAAAAVVVVVVLLLLRLVLGRPVKPAPRVVPDAERKQACVSWSDPIAHLVLRLSVPTHLVNRLSTSAPSIIASNADCDLFPLRQYTTTRSSRLGLRNPYVRSKSSGWSLIASGRTERGRPSALGILPGSISLYSRTSRIVTS